MNSMKHLSSRSAAAVLLALSVLSLTACLNSETEEEDEEEHALVVLVRDSSGAAVSADTVTWSYYGDGAVNLHKVGHGNDSTHKPLARLNAEGTAWQANHEGLHGSIFLRARFNKAVDEFCGDHGYVVRGINADSLPQEVTLILTVTRICL
jgi:hypothetical protein